MSKRNLHFTLSIFVGLLFAVSTGCEDSTPEIETGTNDSIPLPIDSSITRVSGASVYVDGQLNNILTFSYSSSQLTGRLKYVYENDILIDSTFTEFQYDGGDVVSTRSVSSVGGWVPNLRQRTVWEAGRCMEIIRHSYDNGVWSPSSTHEFVYEEDEFRQDILHTVVDGVLSPVNWRTYTHEDGQVVFMESEGVNNGEVIPGNRFDFIYDGSGLSLIDMYIYDLSEEEFLHSGKEEYAEGAYGLLSREGYDYDSDTQMYEAFNSSFYSYDDEGRLAVSAFEVHIGVSSASSTEYTYEVGSGNYSFVYYDPTSAIYRRPSPR